MYCDQTGYMRCVWGTDTAWSYSYVLVAVVMEEGSREARGGKVSGKKNRKCAK